MGGFLLWWMTEFMQASSLWKWSLCWTNTNQQYRLPRGWDFKGVKGGSQVGKVPELQHAKTSHTPIGQDGKKQVQQRKLTWGVFCKGLTSADCQSPGTQWPIAVPGGRTKPKSIPTSKNTGRNLRQEIMQTSTGEDMLMQLKLSFLEYNFVQAEPGKHYSKQPLHSK